MEAVKDAYTHACNHGRADGCGFLHAVRHRKSGAFLGIKPEHDKKDYVRAVIEGIAMNMELILKAYRKHAKIETMCLTGGGAKARHSKEIKLSCSSLQLRHLLI